MKTAFSIALTCFCFLLTGTAYADTYVSMQGYPDFYLSNVEKDYGCTTTTRDAWGNLATVDMDFDCDGFIDQPRQINEYDLQGRETKVTIYDWEKNLFKTIKEVYYGQDGLPEVECTTNGCTAYLERQFSALGELLLVKYAVNPVVWQQEQHCEGDVCQNEGHFVPDTAKWDYWQDEYQYSAYGMTEYKHRRLEDNVVTEIKTYEYNERNGNPTWEKYKIDEDRNENHHCIINIAENSHSPLYYRERTPTDCISSLVIKSTLDLPDGRNVNMAEFFIPSGNGQHYFMNCYVTETDKKNGVNHSFNDSCN